MAAPKSFANTPKHIDNDAARSRLWNELRSAHALFVAIASIAMTAFVFLIPAGWGLDEQSHVARAYQISQGVLSPQLRDDGITYGGDIPVPLVDFLMLGHSWSNSVDRGDWYFNRADFQSPTKYDALARAHISTESATVSFDFTNAGASSALVYAPAALGFAVSRGAGLDVAGMVAVARLFNALVYIVLVCMAIRLLRGSRLRWLVLGIALLPEAVFQSSYVSADTASNAICLFFIAIILRAWSSPDAALSRSVLTSLALASTGLVLAKPTYVVFAGLVLLLPNPTLGGGGRAWVLKGSFTILIAGLTAVLLFTNRGVAGAMRTQLGARSDLVDPTGQVTSLLTHPVELVLVLVRTLVIYGRSWSEGLVAVLGYNTVRIPEPLPTLLAATILLATLSAPKLPRKGALGLVIIGFLACAAVIFALYVTFTPVGAPSADGVQGRYFLPALLPLLVGITSLFRGRLTISDRSLGYLVTVSAVIGIAGAVVLWVANLY